MAFGSFFGNEKSRTKSQNEDVSDELDEKALGRRRFLIGSGALVAASMLHLQEAKADGGLTLEPIITIEDKERNVARIRAYEQRLIALRSIIENPQSSVSEIIDVISLASDTRQGVPALEESILKGTELDHDSWFRRNGSWPSVQVRNESNGEQTVRFANDSNQEHGNIGYGNGSFIGSGKDALFLTNKHVLDQVNELFVCELGKEGTDIGGCSLRDDHSAVEAKVLEHVAKEEVGWDRRKAKEDLHGKLVHIPSIHEERGIASDNTDVTSGVLFKIPENFFWTEDNTDAFFGKNITEGFGAQLRRSYMCIIASRDTNMDGSKDGDDAEGISGSPVLTDADCSKGIDTQSGIAWGTGTIYDKKRAISYTVAFVHGPDVLGEMIDGINTIVSGFMDEAQVPQKEALTKIVQQALKDKGYAVEVDGVYGGGTQKAVFSFQSETFDKETIESSIIKGDVDRRTWDKLLPDYAGVDKKELYEVVASWGL